MRQKSLVCQGILGQGVPRQVGLAICRFGRSVGIIDRIGWGMSAFEWNKIIGATLGALLLALGLGFVSDLVYSDHGDHHEPVFVVEGEAPAPAEDDGDAEPGIEPVTGLLAAADPAAGETVFKKCTVCHSIEAGGANKVGPNLHNIVGADFAAKDGFRYSSAMADAGGSWTYDALNAFLAQPKDFMPGTKMAFPGLKKVGDRADVIAYLRAHTENPPPLPEAASDPDMAAQEDDPGADPDAEGGADAAQ